MITSEKRKTRFYSGMLLYFVTLSCAIFSFFGCDNGGSNSGPFPPRKEISYVEFIDKQVSLYLEVFLNGEMCRAKLVIARVDGSAYTWEGVIEKSRFESLWAAATHAPQTCDDSLNSGGPLGMGRTRFLKGSSLHDVNLILFCYLTDSEWNKRGGALYRVSDSLLSIIGDLLKQTNQHEITSKQLSSLQARMLSLLETDKDK